MQLSNNLKTIHFRKHRKQAIEQEIWHVSHRLESLSSKISRCMAQCAAAGGQPGKGIRARLYDISSYSQLQDWFYSYFMTHIYLKSKLLSREQLNMENFISLIVCVFREKNKRSNHYIILTGTSEDKKNTVDTRIQLCYCSNIHKGYTYGPEEHYCPLKIKTSACCYT